MESRTKRYRVWLRPHGGPQEDLSDKPSNQKPQESGLSCVNLEGRSASGCPVYYSTDRTATNQDGNSAINPPLHKSDDKNKITESQRLGVRFSSTIHVAAAPGETRLPNVTTSATSQSDTEEAPKRIFKDEKELYIPSRWSSWEENKYLSHRSKTQTQELEVSSKNDDTVNCNISRDSLTTSQASTSAGNRFSLSAREVVIEVPRGGTGWGETSLKNEGSAALSFSLRLFHEGQDSESTPGLSGTINSRWNNTGFCAWPLQGVILPGDTQTLHFGYCFSRRSGLQYCFWGLRVCPTSNACVCTVSSSTSTSRTDSGSTIYTVAVVSAPPLPLEGLWQQDKKTCRLHAIDAAEDILRVLLQETFCCAAKREEALTSMDDPLARTAIFTIVNASMNITAPPTVVDSLLLLQHQAKSLECSQGQQLELLHTRFTSPTYKILSEVQSLESGERVTEAPILLEKAETAKAYVPSLSDAIAAGKADITMFSVRALQKQICQLPAEERTQQQQFSWSLRKLLSDCDDSQLVLQDPEKETDLHPALLLQREMERISAAEAALYTALSNAIETFSAALTEALEMAGLACIEDEKGRQAGKNFKRQANRGRRDSKASEDSSRTSATATAAAVAAAAAAIAASNSEPEDDGPQTRQHVAEQLLQWLLNEAIAAAEPQMMLEAAQKAAAWGGVLAEAARHRCQHRLPYEALEQQLQRTPLPSILDRRVHLMAEYLSKKQAHTVKGCTRGVVLFDGSTTAELLSLLQQQPSAEKQIWMQQLLQQRLGYLADLLPESRDGLLLCLEISSTRHQQLQFQHPTLLQQLVQELVEGYLLPALFGDEPQEIQPPIVYLETPEDFAALVDDAYSRQVAAASHHVLPQSPSPASTEDGEYGDAEGLPCLLVVPSWQQFFVAATNKLKSLQKQVTAANSQKISDAAQDGDDDGAATAAETNEYNYLIAKRQLAALSELLHIDFVVLDTPSSICQAEEGSLATEGKIVQKTPQTLAWVSATARASSPWLLENRTTRALGPHAIAYLKAACVLLGIDSSALQQRASEFVADWREERHGRQSLDAAAALAMRKAQRSFETLCTDRRSCCCIIPHVSTQSNGATLNPSPHPQEGRAVNEPLVVIDQQIKHRVTAILCSYWDSAVPMGPAMSAAENTASQELLFKWASLQLQKLRMLVSGTIVSNVLLVGDLVSLVCGLALNGDLAMQPNQQETPKQEDSAVEPYYKADKAAAGAAAAAAAAAEPAEQGRLARGWLRLCKSVTAGSGRNSSIANGGCSIQPRIHGLQQLRKFVHQQLKIILEIAHERDVIIQLPTEVLFRVDPQPGGPPQACAPVETPARVRKTSDAGGGNQRNSTKNRRGNPKRDFSEGHLEDTAAGEAMGVKAAEDDKEASTLLVCHLPPAELLWDVIFAEGSNACTPSEDGSRNSATARRRSQESQENIRACATYAGLTAEAVEAAVCSFGGPNHVLWLGERLSKQADGTDTLLAAAGIFDATTVMMESLLQTKEYKRTPHDERSTIIEFKASQCSCWLLRVAVCRLPPFYRLSVLENSFTSGVDAFGYGAPSQDLATFSPSASFDVDSSQSSMMSNTKSVNMSNIQKKSGVEHLLLFGPIARNSWTLTAEKGALKVEAYLDAQPLLHMLQGRRVKDFLLADDALSMEENVGIK